MENDLRFAVKSIPFVSLSAPTWVGMSLPATMVSSPMPVAALQEKPAEPYPTSAVTLERPSLIRLIVVGQHVRCVFQACKQLGCCTSSRTPQRSSSLQTKGNFENVDKTGNDDGRHKQGPSMKLDTKERWTWCTVEGVEATASIV